VRRINRRELKQIWQKVPVDYYEKGIKINIGQRLWYTTKLATIKKISGDLRPLRILDIGSNGGNLTAKIAKFYPKAKIFGIDIYDKAVKYAQKKYPGVHFQTADAQRLPFRNESFDLIFCLETLEHIVSPSKALKEIKKCLKKDGRAIISMDTGNFFFNLIWFFWTRVGRGRVWQDSHLHRFNYQKLKKKIIDEGFLIEKEIISHLGMEVTFRIKKNDH